MAFHAVVPCRMAGCVQCTAPLCITCLEYRVTVDSSGECWGCRERRSRSDERKEDASHHRV